MLFTNGYLSCFYALEGSGALANCHINGPVLQAGLPALITGNALLRTLMAMYMSQACLPELPTLIRARAAQAFQATVDQMIFFSQNMMPRVFFSGYSKSPDPMMKNLSIFSSMQTTFILLVYLKAAW